MHQGEYRAIQDAPYGRFPIYEIRISTAYPAYDWLSVPLFNSMGVRK